MAETTYEGKWRWHDIMRDLEEQGELKGVEIDLFSVQAHSCGGMTESGTKFMITWVPDTFMLVSMDKEDMELINAFAKIVEYQPLCSYVEASGLITFEWDKKNPEGRYEVLKQQTKKQLKKYTNK
jgi:hypothetical protein